jgi:hypothetical protein
MSGCEPDILQPHNSILSRKPMCAHLEHEEKRATFLPPCHRLLFSLCLKVHANLASFCLLRSSYVRAVTRKNEESVDLQEQRDAMRDTLALNKYRKFQSHKRTSPDAVSIGEALLDRRKPLQNRFTESGIAKQPSSPQAAVEEPSGSSKHMPRGKRYAGRPPSPRLQGNVTGCAPMVRNGADDAFQHSIGRRAKAQSCLSVNDVRPPSTFFAYGPEDNTLHGGTTSIYEFPRRRKDVRPPSAQGRFDPVTQEWKQKPNDPNLQNREAPFQRWVF